MSDLLREAWDLLTPGERPKGMCEVAPGYFRDEDTHGWSTQLRLDAAYDRICQAVEGMLFKAGWCLFVPDTGDEYADRLALTVAVVKAAAS